MTYEDCCLSGCLSPSKTERPPNDCSGSPPSAGSPEHQFPCLKGQTSCWAARTQPAQYASERLSSGGYSCPLSSVGEYGATVIGESLRLGFFEQHHVGIGIRAQNAQSLTVRRPLHICDLLRIEIRDLPPRRSIYRLKPDIIHTILADRIS
jgi:hypothetical protein